MLNIKKSIISKDSFHKAIKHDFPLNKKYENMRDNAHKNVNNIFDSNEKKKAIISYFDKQINKEIREKERSISPLLGNNISTSINNINLITPTKIFKKDFQAVSQEKFFNNSEYHKNRNISMNNISKKYYNKEFSENDEIEKKIKEIKIRNQIEKKFPIRVTKQNNNLKMTFIRINITTVKHKIEDNFLKEKFDFSIKAKRKIEKEKNKFEKESINFYIEGKNKEEYEKEENENFIGFKLSKIEKGKKLKEYYINESIEELNKKFEEENIKINDFPLKFKTYDKIINEIDKVEDIEFIRIKKDKKENKNLIDKGINTIKDKRKFENKGISVNFFPITTQIGVNTDDRTSNYNNEIDNINEDINNVKKSHYRNNSLNNIERGKNYDIDNYYNNRKIKREKLESKNKVTRDKFQKALNEYRSKRIELQEKIYYDESSNNSLQESFALEKSMVEI